MHCLSWWYSELTEVRSWSRGSCNYRSLLLPLLAAAVRGTIYATYGMLLLLLLCVPLVATPKHEKNRL